MGSVTTTMVWLILCPLLISIVQLGNVDASVINTPLGAVQGRDGVTASGVATIEYLGIPYGQPPVGNRRFLPALPVEPWSETFYNATEYAAKCSQVVSTGPEAGQMQGEEDCLNLNIFLPKDRQELLPVMVWIHGGAFVEGSGQDGTPVEIMKEDVIVVTINYRLGALGFLTFGNDLVSGNMGLKDQALAIQWVKQNIESFGGNPKKITILGESSGGMSVHAQVLSPWNYGQIQGAIAQSGTMLYQNSIKSSGEREERFAKYVAEKIFECPSDGHELDETVLECLQRIDVADINNKLGVSNPTAPSPFVWQPVIDNYAENPFLPMDPLEAMQTGMFNKIPFISGTVKNEGAYEVGGFLSQGTRENLLKNWSELVTPLIVCDPTRKDFSPEKIMLANISLKYYNHPKGDSNIDLDQPLMDLITDVSFVSPDQKTVQLMSKHSPDIFNYHLTQQTDNSFFGRLPNQSIEYSPLHGDDLTFLMGHNEKQIDEESALADQMVKYWTNFAKFGHPTPSAQDLPFWDLVTQTENNYMELKAVSEMKQDLLPERMQFWERMLWAAKERDITRKATYIRATQFLLDNTSKQILFQL